MTRQHARKRKVIAAPSKESPDQELAFHREPTFNILSLRMKPCMTVNIAIVGIEVPRPEQVSYYPYLIKSHSPDASEPNFPTCYLSLEGVLVAKL